MSISLLLYNQTEKKLEERRSLVKLFDRDSSNWEELWKPITKKFPEVTLKRIPNFLKSSEISSLYKIKESLKGYKRTEIDVEK